MMYHYIIIQQKVSFSLLEFLLQDVSLESVSNMYELSEAFNAISLRHTCILFILEHFDKLSATPGYLSDLLNRTFTCSFSELFTLLLSKRNFYKLIYRQQPKWIIQLGILFLGGKQYILESWISYSFSFFFIVVQANMLT